MNENKGINILLIILLIICLPILVFVGYNFFKDNSTVEVPDFKNKEYKEVIEWCSSLSSNYACEFVFTSSKETEKNKVIDIKEDKRENLNVVTVTICNEKIDPITLPDLSKNLIKEDIRYWAHDNNIENITYIEEEKEDYKYMQVIRIEPENNIYKDTAVTVYVNKLLNESESDDHNKSDEDIIVKASDYLGLSVSDFESRVKTLGLKPNHNADKDEASSTVSKGNVVWHGSGSYYKGETINYGISKGGVDGIMVSAETYLGLSEDAFKEKAKQLGLKPNHNTDRDSYSDTVGKGKIVWHGSGEYVLDETFNYGLSLGKKDSSDSDDELYISQGQYVDKKESDFRSIAESLGLKPTHLTERDAYSDNVAKGNIITHGYGYYVKNEAFNYGLSLGKKDTSEDNDTLYITNNKYVGKTEAEFRSIAQSLGLKPTHLSERDAYSDTVTKGSIVTHGYGQYEKNEAFNYGLSLGKKDSSGDNGDNDSLYISQNKYVGKTEAEFISIAQSLGLKPTHLSDRDAYSDTVAKGSIVTHGYGQYEKNEAFNYGLSLGKKSSGNDSPNTVNVPSYSGKKESELLSFLSSNNLKAGTRKESYSDSVTKGYIISNDTGNKSKGDSVNYTVSLGAEPINSAYLNSFKDISNLVLATGNYNQAVNNAKAYLDKAGFTNYSFVSSKSRDYGAGVLLSITVDGQNHVSRKEYKKNAAIVFTICDGYE